MNASNRAKATPPSPIRKLVPHADKAKANGVQIFHLNIGQPDIKSPTAYFKALKKIKLPNDYYENSLGNINLRESLAKYYLRHQIIVLPDEIITTTGGSEAIFFALLAVCDPGNEVLVFDPCYANYLGFAAMANIKLVPVKTNAVNGFHLPDTKTIIRHVTDKTKAIIVTNPNNPTGTVYTKSELLDVIKAATVNNLFIIADETYREFVFDGLVHISLLNLDRNSPRIILVDSLSKRYSLCGARLGCLVTKNKAILAAVSKFSQARLASPTLQQLAAVEVINPSSDTYLIQVKKEYEKRRNLVISLLNKIPGVFVKKPEGAFYCVASLPVKNAEDFCSWLLTDFRDHNQTIMLSPVEGFYVKAKSGVNQVRLAYVLNTKKLTRALEILKKALLNYPNN